jgi:hypothetical protein
MRRIVQEGGVAALWATGQTLNIYSMMNYSLGIA